jgi:hypothetical protein
MISNLLQKVLVSATVGTVIGFSTILGAMSSAAAFEGKIKTPVKNAISHVVLYLQDGEGNISAVKIDNFSEVSDEIKEYDPSSFLDTKSGSKLVAYEVKAGKEKYPTLLSIDELPKFKNKDIKEEQYAQFPNPQEDSTTDNQDQVEDTTPTKEQPTATEVEDTTPEIEDTIIPPDPLVTPTLPTPPTITIPSNQTNSSSQPVKVPEPGSIAAIAIFGLGGLFRKKKASS